MHWRAENESHEGMDFSTLKGQVISEIEVNEYKDAITITCADGDVFLMHHEQECCESVRVEDICGDLQDVCGSPVLLAEEVSERGEDDYATWTFYKLATVNGAVTIRWLGESNGYYSEAVDFCRLVEDGGDL